MSRRAHGGAAARCTPATPSTFWRGELDPAEPRTDLPLRVLRGFLCAPIKGLLQRRLWVVIDDRLEARDDEDPAELNKLDAWLVRDRMLHGALDGAPWDGLVDAARAAGSLPLGTSGLLTAHEQQGSAAGIVGAVRHLLAGATPERRRVEGMVDGVRLHETLGGLIPGHRVWWSASKLKPGRYIEGWMEHLLLCAFDPDPEPRCSWLIGQEEKGEPRFARFHPVDRIAAREHLAELVELYQQGQRIPLPFAPAPSWAWVKATRNGSTPDEADAAAARAWATDFDGGKDPHVQLVFGTEVPVGDLSAFGVDLPEELQFGPLAARILTPLWSHFEPLAELP